MCYSIVCSYLGGRCNPRECPYRSRDTYPNCICKERYRYVRQNNYCYFYPSNSRRKYPNCKDHLHKYEPETNDCLRCQENSEGVYSHCHCNDGYFSRICIESPASATNILLVHVTTRVRYLVRLSISAITAVQKTLREFIPTVIMVIILSTTLLILNVEATSKTK